MNQNQLNLIAERLKIKPDQLEALKLVLIDGQTSYQAEKGVYRRITGTVARRVKQVQAELEYCLEVAKI